MAELVMLADIQWTVYPEEVSRLLHVMVQAREGSLVIDRRSNHCAMPRVVKLSKVYVGLYSASMRKRLNVLRYGSHNVNCKQHHICLYSQS